MEKLKFFVKRLYNSLKSLGKDIFVLFFSVLLAFSVDRMYENYQEKEKLQIALRNFYSETKQDVTERKGIDYANIDSSIVRLNRCLEKDDISLIEIDAEHNLAHFSVFSISLSYIEKNPNLVFDTEMQYQISKMLSSFRGLSFCADKMKEFRLSEAFIAKGADARKAKMLMVNIIKETRRNLRNFEGDFVDFEKLLVKRKIISG